MVVFLYTHRFLNGLQTSALSVDEFDWSHSLIKDQFLLAHCAQSTEVCPAFSSPAALYTIPTSSQPSLSSHSSYSLALTLKLTVSVWKILIHLTGTKTAKNLMKPQRKRFPSLLSYSPTQEHPWTVQYNWSLI